jgi:uncharacterized membrane protein (UPF0127 family)
MSAFESKKSRFFLIALIAIFLSATVYFFFIATQGKLLSNGSSQSVTISGVKFNAEIASTPSARILGLSYRRSLAADAGMLFLFNTIGRYGFWMKDMHFPLDMIWIKGDTVIGAAENIPAPVSGTPDSNLQKYYPLEPVNKVFEVNAGTVAKSGIKVGDKAILDF